MVGREPVTSVVCVHMSYASGRHFVQNPGPANVLNRILRGDSLSYITKVTAEAIVLPESDRSQLRLQRLRLADHGCCAALN